MLAAYITASGQSTCLMRGWSLDLSLSLTLVSVCFSSNCNIS